MKRWTLMMFFVFTLFPGPCGFTKFIPKAPSNGNFGPHHLSPVKHNSRDIRRRSRILLQHPSANDAGERRRHQNGVGDAGNDGS